MSKTMQSLYSELYDFPRLQTSPKTTYMVATIPRTGSTLFTSKLWATGGLGAPLEYVNLLANRDMVGRIANNDYNQFWKALLAVRQSPNGVFGFKAFAQCFSAMSVKCPEALKDIRSDHVIYLTREDKVAQAISYARASQTVQWFSDVNSGIAPALNIKLLEEASSWIASQEASWERLFKLTETTPLRLSYEELSSDWDGTFDRVLRHLNVSVANCHRLDIPLLAVQRDEVSTYWHHVYSEHLARSTMVA